MSEHIKLWSRHVVGHGYLHNLWIHLEPAKLLSVGLREKVHLSNLDPLDSKETFSGITINFKCILLKLFWLVGHWMAVLAFWLQCLDKKFPAYSDLFVTQREKKILSNLAGSWVMRQTLWLSVGNEEKDGHIPMPSSISISRLDISVMGFIKHAPVPLAWTSKFSKYSNTIQSNGDKLLKIEWKFTKEFIFWNLEKLK